MIYVFLLVSLAGEPAAVATLESWLRECAIVDDSLRGFCVRDWGSTGQ